MQLQFNGKDYEVIIDKKIGNRNTYIRVKDDLKIYVTTNTFTSNKEIARIISENEKSIAKMIEKQENRKTHHK